MEIEIIKSNIQNNYEYYSFGILVFVLYFSPTLFLSIITVSCLYYIFNNVRQEFTIDLKFTNKKNKPFRTFFSSKENEQMTINDNKNE